MEAAALRTEEVQQYLEENDLLLEAIRHAQNRGKLHECVQYQMQLQQNLIYLGTHADETAKLQNLRIHPPVAPRPR